MPAPTIPESNGALDAVSTPELVEAMAPTVEMFEFALMHWNPLVDDRLPELPNPVVNRYSPVVRTLALVTLPPEAFAAVSVTLDALV